MGEKKKRRFNRKGFLRVCGQLLGGLTLGSFALNACRKPEGSVNIQKEKTYIWKMVTTWPKNFPGLGVGAENLAKWITAMSGGRLKVKIYAAGELIPAFEVFHAVSSGTADMGHGSPYYWKGIVPEAQFFAAVPFGLNGNEMSGWIRYGGGQTLWDKLYADFNLKPFPCGNTGVQMGGWFKKTVKEKNDFKGLKIRMPGLGGEVLRRFGATPVVLPGGEVFQALRSGTIDAAEWVGPYNDLAFGLHKAAKYYYWPGWHEPGTVLELVVNRKKYEELPQDLQAIVQYAAKAAYEEMFSEFTARNNEALVLLVKKHGVKLKRFSDDFLREAGVISESVIAELGGRNPVSQKILKSYLAFRKGALKWNSIGEGGFTLARMLSEKS